MLSFRISLRGHEVEIIKLMITPGTCEEGG